MEHCQSFQQNALIASHEGIRGLFSILGPKDSIVCPMPRRATLSPFSSLWPMKYNMSHEIEQCNSEAGLELLDPLAKLDSVVDMDHASEIAPLFSGSPPSRAINPLIQDAKFKYEASNLFTVFPDVSQQGLPSPPLYGHNGYMRRPTKAKPPASVRIEGFNILGRESKNTASLQLLE
ncbi:hypothetical protein SAY86_004512 [Trapa natans]|uniref:Uncharacterized protein n=1 Tax=Trapa natans TaxID=22666 RepID=A0AAN7RIX2_TRANT|nr:hypothetical protein SAY86_004512 [Trapa natans]